MPLSDLVQQYRKEYSYHLPVPSHTKLSTWVRQFASVTVVRDRKNNQTYILEKKPVTCNKIKRHVDTGEIQNKTKTEERLFTLLKQRNNRIQLSEVAMEYKKSFNEDLLVPAGMKLRRWFEQFSTIAIDHNTHKNQTYLVLQLDNNKESVAEHNILSLLRDNDGCVGLSSLADLYQHKFNKSLLIPVGKKLSHWLCSFNSIVLTQKPSNNEMYICLKHPVQRAFEEKLNFNCTTETVEEKPKNPSHNVLSQNENLFEPQGSTIQEGNGYMGKHLATKCIHTPLNSNKADTQYQKDERIETQTAKDPNDMPKEPNARTSKPTIVTEKAPSDRKSLENSHQSVLLSVKKEDLEEELTRNAHITSIGDEILVNQSDYNHNEDEDKSQLSMSSHMTSTTENNFWLMLGEDQKEAMIEEVAQMLGNSLFNASTFEEMMKGREPK
jgi:hypothetical protein